ncbi:MAG: site-specific DNA-methyltransferase [Chloroflexota bacterium]|nr:site-specific DNA-methyltransferase [Chloroflexota bacterium]MDE2947729.1 site-specific DNA-methyltransferase [Chloroflexota bacterium]
MTRDYHVVESDIDSFLASPAYADLEIDLTFLDPPFNQAKDYASHDDDMPEAEYWDWMKRVCGAVYRQTSEGGAIYFMQREKNSEQVLSCLRESGWTLQNLIIWKKLTSAVPMRRRYGKQYQIIAYATKGRKARVFNRLRIDPPLPANYKHKRTNGMYVTDIWDDIRELTAGYFAGDEALRDSDGLRFHKQQAPIALLLRIILSSTQVGDCVFDPFAGTGTTLAVAQQLGRRELGVEINSDNAACIRERLREIRPVDDIERFRDDYRFTENLEAIWEGEVELGEQSVLDLPLFRSSVS